MPDFKNLELFLLRYVPNVATAEFVNIGFILIEQDANGNGFADVRFTKDWRKVECLDPQADIEILQALETNIRQELHDPQSRESLIRRLNDTISGVIQLSPGSAVLAQDPAKEVEALEKLYFERIQGARRLKLSGRQLIVKRIESELESAGVLQLVDRNFPVKNFTAPGDPLRFDFYYGAGDEIKFLQAVSLKTSVDQAIILGARFPAIAAKIQEKQAAVARMTAIVDEGLDVRPMEVKYALEMMRDSRIQVEPLSQMPALAESIRKELRA